MHCTIKQVSIYCKRSYIVYFKLELNNYKISKKSPNIWKLSNTSPNNPRVKIEFLLKIRIHFKLNDNENTTYLNCTMLLKQFLEKFIAFNAI